MEKIFVKDLEVNQVVVSSFMVIYKELRQKKDGANFLSLTLSDKTGDLLAIMWDNFQEIVDSIEVNDFVKVRGSVNIYNDRLQMIVQRIKKLDEDEVNPADYLPSSKEDPEAMFQRLEEVISSIKNPHLRRLLEQIFSNDELSYSRSFNYTDEGRLLGHILMQCQWVDKEMDKLEDFPPELRLQLLHLLASHHGSYEFGSPRRPKTLEALVLHYLDDMDAKVESMQQSISGHPTLKGNWSPFNKILERYIYRKKVEEEE